MPKILLHILIFLFPFFFLLFTFSPNVFAQEEFDINYNTSYVVNASGDADVTQEITLANNFSKIYASSYTLILEGKKPENIKAFQGNEELNAQVLEEGKQTKISVSFPDALVGKAKARHFLIKYKILGIAVQNGQVWELTVPKIASPESINTYNLTLHIPKSFGNPAYISPEPASRNSNTDSQIFEFKKDDLIKAGIVSAFGEFQVYNFDLIYHLQNPYSEIGETEIAFPPETNYQKVYYSLIDPKPLSVKVDGDGNWLAKYKLQPKQKLEIKAGLSVQVFAQPQTINSNKNPVNKTQYLSATKYWEVSDPQIQQAASTLKTPQDVYNYVVRTLNYDYGRVQENVIRLGGKNALTNPNKAICMEFTDLFITLARSAGIPAREINGYAYTENPKIQPLSLVADVLHAWPEYWQDGSWKQVDPTWEDTTGGVDFFNKFDLSHVTFVIHGKDPTSPLPAGSYKIDSDPQKDVSVQFGQLPQIRKSKVDIDVSTQKVSFPFSPTQAEITISNSGPVAFYNLPIKLEGNGVEIIKQDTSEVSFLAPFDTKNVKFLFKIPFSLTGGKKNIGIFVQDQYLEYNVPLQQVYITRVAVGFAIILACVGIFLLFTLLLLPKIIPTIKSINLTRR